MQPWPAELAQQIEAVSAVVAQAAAPMTVDQVAARFRCTQPERVRPSLDTLTALALVRPTPEGVYAGGLQLSTTSRGDALKLSSRP